MWKWAGDMGTCVKGMCEWKRGGKLKQDSGKSIRWDREWRRMVQKIGEEMGDKRRGCLEKRR